MFDWLLGSPLILETYYFLLLVFFFHFPRVLVNYFIQEFIHMRKHFNSLHTRLCPHSPSQTMASLNGWQGVMLLPQNPHGSDPGTSRGLHTWLPGGLGKRQHRKEHLYIRQCSAVVSSVSTCYLLILCNYCPDCTATLILGGFPGGTK